MPLDEDIYKSASKLLLSHASDKYDDLCNTWRDLEAKAQGNVAIAGIFLTGTTVVLRFAENINGGLTILFLAAFAFLAATALISIFVLRVSEVDVMEDSGVILKSARRIFDADNSDTAKREIRAYVIDRAEEWEKINESLHRANTSKANKLAFAQYVLMVSILLVALSITFALYPTLAVHSRQ